MSKPKTPEEVRQKSRRAARKLGFDNAERRIFMCVPKKAKCASKKEISEAWSHLKKRLKKKGLAGREGVLRFKVDCFDVCHGGPIVLIEPDGAWYGQCSPAVLDRIVEEHLLAGDPVDEYLISARNVACSSSYHGL